MQVIDHLKTAEKVGIILGLLIGFIDITVRLALWSFEWFEFYQTLFFSLLISILLFTGLGLIVGLVSKWWKLGYEKKVYMRFYIANAVLFLLWFYGSMFIVVGSFLITYLLVHVLKIVSMDFQVFRDKVTIVIRFILILVAVLFYSYLLIKGSRLVGLVLGFFQQKRVHSILENLVFFVLLFICFSFLTDIYLLNHTPSFTSTGVDLPNIILITLDTTRADHLTVYGYEKNTSPNLAKLAEKSVIFEHAEATTSWTLPSHASIFTGKYLYKHQTNLRNQIVSNDQVLLPELLVMKGYVTAAVTANAYNKDRFGLGQGLMFHRDRLDFFEDVRHFDRFDIRTYIKKKLGSLYWKLLHLDGELTAEEVNKEVFAFLEKNKDTTFYLFINYFDPHIPYNLGMKNKHLFINFSFSFSDFKPYMDSDRNAPVPEKITKGAMGLYDTEIYYLDTQLGELFTKLNKLGLMNNTILVITADHGEEFYDHGDFQHARTLYQEVLHVPLIISYPEKFKPKRVKERVSIIDIFSTLLDFANITIPDDVDSVSLIPLMQGNGEQHGGIIAELWGRIGIDKEGVQQAVYEGDWKLIESNPGDIVPPGLFNLRTDPHEKNNLYEEKKLRRQKLYEKIPKEVLPSLEKH